MSDVRSFLVCWFIFAISIFHAWGRDSLPIMELYAPDVNSVVKTSGCKDGLINDVDFFTVRGKVNKNGSNSDAYKDTNLYLQAVKDPSTNAWASQCRPDLTVCGSTLNKDCYCESKDGNGDYHIVMTIMAKSIYSGGKLILSWNDARSPYNPPILGNQVEYYPDPISDRLKLTSKIGSTVLTLVTGQKVDPDIFTNVTAQFCLENLAGISLFEIKENGKTLAQTTTDSCLTLDFTEKSPTGVWTVSYTESGRCERTGVIRIVFPLESDGGHEVIIIVICCCLFVAVCGCILGAILCWRKMKRKKMDISSVKNTSSNMSDEEKDSETEKRTELASEGAIQNDKANAKDGSHEERKKVKVGQNELSSSISDSLSDSNNGWRSKLTNDVEMTEMKRMRKKIKADYIAPIDTNGNEARYRSKKEHTSDMVNVEEIGSNRDMNYMPVNERMSEILKDLTKTYEQMKNKKKRNQKKGTEAVDEQLIDNDTINVHNGSTEDQKGDIVRLRRAWSFPSLILKKEDMVRFRRTWSFPSMNVKNPPASSWN